MDLALPRAVPVADLVPELARGVGLLDAATVHGGYRLVVRDGRVLAPDTGLGAQGVEEGAVITVAAGVDDEPLRLHDDRAEAMAEAVARHLVAWDSGTARRARLQVAATLLLLGAGCLAVRHDPGAAVMAMQLAGALLVTAVVLSRVTRDTPAALTCALLGCVYAGTAAASSARSPAEALVLGGVALVVVGVVCFLGVADGRLLLLAPGVVGATALTSGLAAKATACDPAVVLTVVLVLVVLAGHGFSCVALYVATTRGRHVGGPLSVDPRQIAADARMAHQVLVSMSAAAGAVLVLAAPAAVSLGASGTVVSALAGVAVVLRAGRQRERCLFCLELWSGVTGVAVTVLATLWLHRDWPEGVCVALVVLGLVISRLASAPESSATRRVAAAAEALCLLAMVPALTTATGLLSLVAG